MSDDRWVGRTLGGRYRLTSPLGAGGMGAVYRAIQDPLGREVAVKVLHAQLGQDAESRERFEREARALAKLNHANIVVLHDFGRADDDTLFLVMESVRGRSLRALLQTHGKLPWERAARLCEQVARGLRAAHAAGVIHADLKPENVVLHRPVGEAEQAKLLDFGLARLSESGDSDVTVAGAIVGTPRYLSPERIQGVRDDPRSDLYALGVTLFEMLVGHAPFQSAMPAMLLVQHISEAPRRPSEDGAVLPEVLDDLVLQLLAKDPAERPADADAVVRALEDILEAASPPSLEASMEGAPISDEPEEGTVELSWPPMRIGAPVGRVTLVFTDIESSSSLWDAAPMVMREALHVHDEVMRQTLAVRGGYEVKTQGDSFMVTFADPDDALHWCLDVQEALLVAPWPEGLAEQPPAQDQVAADGQVLHRGLRVRMGVFEGEPECRPDPLTDRMDYFGPVVNRAARVEAAANGGQIFVGGHLAHVAAKMLGESSATVTDLGDHRLKGIEGVERLAEVRAIRFSAREPLPPRTLTDDGPSTNLMHDQDLFIGRELDLERVAEAFSSTNLVTLLGPGGTGKTRLSRRYGEQELTRFSGGVWFVDLTSATTRVGVATSTAEAVGLKLLGGETFEASVELLGRHLSRRGPQLLLFDNFEQVVEDAVETIAVWRKLAPETRFLVTSRIPLQLEAERTIEIAPLEVEHGVELFTQRCQRDLSVDDLALVREIVTALDGLPLAIELAAARARVLSPRRILDRLGKRLDFLKESRRDRTSRQTNLRGAIDWSWDLLSEPERAAFAQCGAFYDGFTLDAAEEIIEVEDDVLDALQSLKEKSLLLARPTFDGELRFGMYATIRAYAAEKLVERDDGEATFRRHAEYYVALGEAAALAIHGPNAEQAAADLSSERENLLGLSRHFEERAPAFTARALTALERLFAVRGPYQGRVDLLMRAVQAAGRAGDSAAEMGARLSLGRFHAVEGDALRARDNLVRAAELADAAGDDDAFVMAVAYLGRSAFRRGALAETTEWERRGQERAPRCGPYARALLDGSEAMRALRTGEMDAAAALGRSALALARQAGERSFEGRTLSNMGVHAMLRGDLPGALDYYREAYEVLDSLGERPMVGMVLGNLGMVHFTMREDAPARDYFERAIAIHHEVGNALLIASDEMNLGMLLFEQGDRETAERVTTDALAFFQSRVGMIREESTALTGLLFFAGARGDLAEVRRLHEQLEAFSATFPELVYFASDVVRIVNARVSLAEAVATADPDEAARLKTSALESYEAARGTPIFFLHAYVRWLRSALEDAGVDVPEELFRLAV